MNLLSIPDFADYALLDCGGLEKLERFGKVILRRPEPQAVWQKVWEEEEWVRRAEATFVRKSVSASGEDSGNWTLKRGVPEQWHIAYKYEKMALRFRLGMTSFKHVGIFPEQAANWTYLYDFLVKKQQPTVLNLFAYTGGASLAARAAGADVTHVDSVKPVITWARENMEASGQEGIRWVVEDALKFAQREARRGKKYNCLILDPPAYGRGPDGEKWVLDKQIDELLGVCAQILADDAIFVLNLYSMGFSAMIADNLVKRHFGKTFKSYQFGELYVPAESGVNLPLGTYVRFTR